MRFFKHKTLNAPTSQGCPVSPKKWSRAVDAARWLRRRAENVAALLLLMFLSFILQIVLRYVFNHPLGWTDEVSVIAGSGCMLWGAAFVVRETGRDPLRHHLQRESRAALRRSR